MDAQKTIVVGIDGSACARDALRFAVKEARLRGDQLRVVWTWQMPINIYAAGGLMAVLDDGTAERLARRELDEGSETILALLSSCSSKREARRACSFGSLRTPSYSS